MSAPQSTIRGTQGYGTAELVARYETLSFLQKHEEAMHLLPQKPSRVLDVGAGTGADAAWLAAQGHNVCAVEPTEAFRHYGQVHHASSHIEWVDDSLPLLSNIVAKREQFDLIMLTAVWMHLDAAERSDAMTTLANLLAPNGVLLMVVRHGAVPPGRVMFEVSAEETVELAKQCGLACVLSVETASKLPENQSAGVTWSRLGFRSM